MQFLLLYWTVKCLNLENCVKLLEIVTSPTNYKTNVRTFKMIDCRMSSSRPRTTSFVDANKSNNPNFGGMKISSKDGSKVSLCYWYVSKSLLVWMYKYNVYPADIAILFCIGMYWIFPNFFLIWKRYDMHFFSLGRISSTYPVIQLTQRYL